MPAVDDPFSIAASLPGQLATLKAQVKDLSVNRTQSPSILTVGAGGITDLGALAVTGLTTLSSAVTLGGGVTGPVAATGAISGTTITGTGAISGASVAVTGAITGASVAVTGAASSATSAVAGSSTVGGTSTSTGVVISPGSRAYSVVSGYAGAWINGDGTLGISTSSVDVKQDFAPADSAPKVDALLRLALVDFRRIGAVAELGVDAPVELGAIVEYVAGTALVGATFVDPTGKPQGINWSEMIPVMIAAIQSLNARIAKLETPTA